MTAVACRQTHDCHLPTDLWFPILNTTRFLTTDHV
jgi:hypothetical protein